jgi:hypothetical protein
MRRQHPHQQRRARPAERGHEQRLQAGRVPRLQRTALPADEDKFLARAIGERRAQAKLEGPAQDQGVDEQREPALRRPGQVGMTGGHLRAGELRLAGRHDQSWHDRLYVLDRPGRGEDVPAHPHRPGIARAGFDRGVDRRFQQPFLLPAVDRAHREVCDRRRGCHE